MSQQSHFPTQAESFDYIRRMLKKDLPKSDKEESFNWNFILKRFASRSKKVKPIKKKKKFLTRKQRKQLDLLKLPKTDWKYNDLEPLRALWQEYMKKNLANLTRIPSPDDPAWTALNATLAKSEFVGAEVTVVRSAVPSTVGITGTIVLETKESFQVVTPKSKLKVLLKRPSVFSFTMDNIKFTLFGKHITVKPNERSVKKFKSLLIPDI